MHEDITKTSRIKVIDGLRAIAVLWVIACHCAFFLGFFLPKERFIALSSQKWIAVFLNGHLGVDLFFVISGFLIALLLLEELKLTGTISLGKFYVRRAFRIIPVYWLILFLIVAFIPEASTPHFWANLIFVNNFLPLKNQAMSWTWSLAIEEQFYFIFPILIIVLTRFKLRPFPFFAGMLGLGFLIRFALVMRYRSEFPLPLHPVIDEVSFHRIIDILYGKTYTRFGGLLCGVLAALIYHSNKRLPFFTHRRVLAVSLAFLSLLTILFISTTVVNGESPENLSFLRIIYFSVDKYFFSAAVAYLLLFLLSNAPYARLPSRIFTAEMWYPIAELSYAAYLVHPIIIFSCYLLLLNDDPGPVHFASAVIMSFALTFFSSYWLHKLVERPMRNWGKTIALRYMVIFERYRIRPW